MSEREVYYVIILDFDDCVCWFIITHDPTVAERCKRQIEISDGKIIV